MLVYSNKKWILIDIIETIVKKKKKNLIAKFSISEVHLPTYFTKEGLP